MAMVAPKIGHFATNTNSQGVWTYLSSQEEASEQKLSYSRCKQALISNLTAWLTAVKNQFQSAGYAVEGSLSEQQIITDNR